MDFTLLKNRYFLLRHGESEANVRSIIVGDPAIGTVQYGLTPLGKMQVQSSVKASDIRGNDIIVMSSDFLRTKETANIAAEIMGTDQIIFTPLLRERYFGELENQTHDEFHSVWNNDATNPTHATHNIESVLSVLKRMEQCLQECEDSYDDTTIVLVSHGDPIDILRTESMGLKMGMHKTIKKIQTGEILPLIEAATK